MMKHHIFFFISIISILFSSCWNDNSETNTRKIVPPSKSSFQYGLNTGKYNFVKDSIREGDTFSKILNEKNVNIKHIQTLVELSKDLITPQNFRVDKPYTLVFNKENPDSLAYFIYEPEVTHYIKFGTHDSLYVEQVNRKITAVQKEVGGEIQNSLLEDMTNAGVSFNVAYQFSQIFEYTVDYFHLQPNDKFKVIYQEKYVDDTIKTKFSEVKAAYFEHKGKSIYGFYFQTDSINKKGGFYDENGNMMKRMFLKAPLDIFRITSRFGMRYHPVLHRMKEHFGTDYAAPTGTPIRATASGTVINTGFSGGNGNYVRIKHNQTYETQYLHMSKIIAKKGQYVQQGEVIGLVGSTGLATGPHVCYRFWKNGKQVDPLKETLPDAQPIDEKLREKYLAYVQPIKNQLDNIVCQPAKNDEAQLKAMQEEIENQEKTMK